VAVGRRPDGKLIVVRSTGLRPHLHGELRADRRWPCSFHVEERGHRFVRGDDGRVFGENESWLSALLRGKPGVDAHGPWDLQYEGWIFEGRLAPFPQPAEPVSGESFAMRTAPDGDAAAASPLAPLPDPMTPAAFYYTLETAGEPNWGVERESPDGTVLEIRGQEQVERMEATDPRASGLLTSSLNRTQVEVDGAGVQTGSTWMRLTNEGGSWSGPGQVMLSFSDEIIAMTGVTTLSGEGGYEGLTLFLTTSGDFLSQQSWGLIVPNELVAPAP